MKENGQNGDLLESAFYISPSEDEDYYHILNRFEELKVVTELSDDDLSEVEHINIGPHEDDLNPNYLTKDESDENKENVDTLSLEGKEDLIKENSITDLEEINEGVNSLKSGTTIKISDYFSDSNEENLTQKTGYLSRNQRRKINKKVRKGKKEEKKEELELFGEKQLNLTKEIEIMKASKYPIYRSIYILNELSEIDKQLRLLCGNPGSELILYPMLKDFRNIISDLISRYGLSYKLQGRGNNKYFFVYSNNKSLNTITNEKEFTFNQLENLPQPVKGLSFTLINLLQLYHTKYVKSIMRDLKNKDMDLSFKALKFISNSPNDVPTNITISNKVKPKHDTIIFEDVPPISENNIGFKLLSKMGYEQVENQDDLINSNLKVKFRSKGIGLGYTPI